MSSHTSISQDKLARLIGTAKTPVLIDVRTDEDFAADPRLIPGAVRRSHHDAADWSREYSGGAAIVVCMRGPKIDRIACPWLIRRFVDPNAVFLFVAPAEVVAVGERFNAVPFDIENVFWSHRGELCTFDVMIEEFGLATPPLLRLATMVRGADTARLDLCPEAPGLLAASLGLSRMYDDDLEQLEAGIALYDAFYRWCRDATGETHNWPTNKAKP